MSLRNETDYIFPPAWGRYSPEQKCEWYTEERAYRQALRQETRWSRDVRRALFERRDLL